MKHSLALSVGLVALSFGVASPAMAQMKTSKPAEPKVASPAATSSATPSVEVELPATPSATMSLPVAAAPAAPASAGGGFSWPKSPVPISVGVVFDGPGSLSTGGFEQVPLTGVAQANVPGLGTAQTAASGYGLTAELGLPIVTLGARLQNYGFEASPTAKFENLPSVPGATPNPPATMAAFFPTGYQEVSASAFGLSLGYRNESFGGGANYAGTYGSIMGGLGLGFGLFDLVGVNAGLKAGYTVATPEALPKNIKHMPVDGDAHVYAKLFMVKAKLGYKLAGAVNADPGELVAALTNPSSLIPKDGTGIPQEKVDTLTATRYGLYSGPYMGIELSF
ncbi:MAG TPA: hypothetical protein V6D00_08895 [Pantanalinema sp.]